MMISIPSKTSIHHSSIIIGSDMVINTHLGILASLLALGILGCLVYTAMNEMNSKEATLLGIILSIMSMLFSLLLYMNGNHNAIKEAKSQHNLYYKTYASNAAEKVETISNELLRLSNYLDENLEAIERRDDMDMILEKQILLEKIKSTILNIQTLKSMTDATLSDWEGVVKDEFKSPSFPTQINESQNGKQEVVFPQIVE